MGGTGTAEGVRPKLQTLKTVLDYYKTEAVAAESKINNDMFVQKMNEILTKKEDAIAKQDREFQKLEPTKNATVTLYGEKTTCELKDFFKMITTFLDEAISAQADIKTRDEKIAKENRSKKAATKRKAAARKKNARRIHKDEKPKTPKPTRPRPPKTPRPPKRNNKDSKKPSGLPASKSGSKTTSLTSPTITPS